MNNQTHKLTEGAMMVAIVGVLLFVNRQFANAIELFMYWILSFPILVYTAKYGIKDALLPSVSMLLLSFMIAAPTTIFYLFCCIVTGLIYGGGVRKEWKNGTLLVWTGIIGFLSYLITTVFLAALFGYHPSDDIEMVKTLLAFFDVNIAGIRFSMVIQIIVVMMAVLMSVLQTICIHLFSNILLKRLNIGVHEMISLFELRVPRVSGVIIIIIWLLFSGRNVIELSQEVSSVLFIAFLCSSVFAVGYGTLTCMMFCIVKRKRVFLFLVLIGVFIKYIQIGIALIGIVDMLFLLRKKMKRGVLYG